ncbi:unnamed protein product [Protopolystoma xenopodis]|uniref:Uncharacterized protein n=1 Tax=Protopolystoma xenopodis TaxID=117903 RepID=A0A448XG36_9PLAT|nr:unnamed protein product [Protopolystoma xenopodis]
MSFAVSSLLSNSRSTWPICVYNRVLSVPLLFLRAPSLSLSPSERAQPEGEGWSGVCGDRVKDNLISHFGPSQQPIRTGQTAVCRGPEATNHTTCSTGQSGLTTRSLSSLTLAHVYSPCSRLLQTPPRGRLLHLSQTHPGSHRPSTVNGIAVAGVAGSSSDLSQLYVHYKAHGQDVQLETYCPTSSLTNSPIFPPPIASVPASPFPQVKSSQVRPNRLQSSQVESLLIHNSRLEKSGYRSRSSRLLCPPSGLFTSR